MIGVYEIGGQDRVDNTLLCRGCAADRRREYRAAGMKVDELYAVDSIEGECDDCGETE